MNIFASDPNSLQSAINLDDKRVKHMPRECFEMISMAYYMNTKTAIAPFIIWNREKRTQQVKFDELFDNVCTRWVAASRENMWWLWQHAMDLIEETYYRFGKGHYLFQEFLAISHYIPEAKNNPKNFPNASGFQDTDIHEAYKKCLRVKWFETDEIKPVYWTKRNKPNWANPIIRVNQGELFDNTPDEFDDLPF